MKNILLLGLCCAPFLSKAQRNFEIKEGSSKYNAVIKVEVCTEDRCDGAGTVTLLTKSGKVLQTLTSEDLIFNLSGTQKPTVNVIELYAEQSPLIFEDFNFDGSEDLAIRNGNNSSYGGPSYDVYVYNRTRKKFMRSEELTALAVENLGMFQTDSERKRLITFAKSGCCWHSTTEYAVVPGKGLQKTYEKEEDATGIEDEMTVTTRRLIGGKWKVQQKKYNRDKYYKD